MDAISGRGLRTRVRGPLHRLALEGPHESNVFIDQVKISFASFLERRNTLRIRVHLCGMLQALWRNGRVVEGTCLENKQGESSRGFKSYFLRQMLNPPLMGGFSFLYIEYAPFVYWMRLARLTPRIWRKYGERNRPLRRGREARNIQPRRLTRQPSAGRAGTLKTGYCGTGIRNSHLPLLGGGRFR